MGSATDVDTLEVRWPSGIVETITGIAADQVLTVVEGAIVGLPDDDTVLKDLALSNCPNPFNPATQIQYELPLSGPVTLEVYDCSGRLVCRLLDRVPHGAGEYTLPWGGRDSQGTSVATGVYFYRLVLDGEEVTRKMVLLK